MRHSFAYGLAALLSLTMIDAAHAAGVVTLNGAPIRPAETRPEITVNIVEFRDGTSNVTTLQPQSKRYAVTLVTRSAIPVLEAQLPANASAVRFTIGTETGRTFHNCLVAGLKVDHDDGRRNAYAMRCEDVTP